MKSLLLILSVLFMCSCTKPLPSRYSRTIRIEAKFIHNDDRDLMTVADINGDTVDIQFLPKY